VKILFIVWSYLKARPLNTVINILLLGLGIAVVTVLLLFSKQLEQKINANAQGIDLVVGAKGSPLQLILCNIFHIDYPTGNINLSEAERIAKNRLVKKAIPLALGDSYQSFRIIGTNQEYADLYDPTLAMGAWFTKPLEVTLGSTVAQITGLKIGDQFAGAHGLAEGGHTHNDHQYTVVGIMKPTASVLDNVILTQVESVWIMHHEEDESESDHNHEHDHDHEHQDHDHGDHHHHHHGPKNPSKLVASVEAGDSTKEITSMLIQYRSPMGAIQMPRIVNGQSTLQAASPAFETARLFSILGIGADVILVFAYVLIFISALSIFIALYNSLKERRYDMAIMRSMGASRSRLMWMMLLEGMVLTLIGCVVGFCIGHGVIIALTAWVADAQKIGLTGYTVYQEEVYILVGSLLLGVVCSLIPAIQAYKTDISKVLAGN
jgi:putative ABC transport system permease protein